MYKVLYTKYSTERHKKFMIKTSIVEENGVKYITKTPMNNESREYVMSLSKKYEALSRLYDASGICINKCEFVEDGIKLDFVEGITFEELLDESYLKQEYDKLLELIKDYKERIIDSVSSGRFVSTQEFVEVFGELELSFDLPAVEVSDIDMIFGNIIIDDSNNWNIIDYEWSFDFAVPANFILYRALSDYLYKHNKRDDLWEMDILRRFGISEEEEQIYANMDKSFHEYVKGNHVTLQEINEDIGNARLYAQDFTRTLVPGRVQVFLDKGDGFAEENAFFVSCPLNESGDYVLSLEGLEGVRGVRIDPTDTFCVAKIVDRQSFYIGENEGISHFWSNGIELDKETYVYNTDDPQWVIQCEDTKLSALKIIFNVSNIDSKVAQMFIANNEKRHKEYVDMLTHKDRELKRFHDEIENRGMEINRCYKEIDSKTEEINRCYKEIDSKVEEINRCNQAISKLEEEKQVILTSTSWKITAPLRKIKGE